ncbi:MAG: cytochrome P450 [Rhizobiales bacterium TMED94]|nr:cytochrome P450 [Rhodobiaceae bacterium]RPF88731.1 MAG: cytochrome P450 [Rhizobiales bacterium TMED94]|tara:strand:- start:947 stop:2209 length:1263 start_codon:yes stop_codon:yes gene_type:complete
MDKKIEIPDAYSVPLDKIHPAEPALFKNNVMWSYFERLRKEDPVHYCKRPFDMGMGEFLDEEIGPYWSITKYNDIMDVDTNHKVFSSEPAITLFDPREEFTTPMFIAMDPPKHDVQRKAVNPVVAPSNLKNMEGLIRERTQNVLDNLPRNKPFDWVKSVSIELTTQMLATLFDFPFEDRYKLTRWSDVATARPGDGVIETDEQRYAELFECLEYFTKLWNERVNSEPKTDLISMLAHNPLTRNMEPMEYLGNLILLIVGGNDTTRNSMTGGVVALNQNPDQYDKLRKNHDLIYSMVPEIIRWQTPLAYMRRTALEDTEIRGKKIKKGDKVVMWYVSGNRDEEVIDNPNAFIIDRERPRTHLSFGFGIHRCVGNRLADMQLEILWEEIMKRFNNIEVLEEPELVNSSFVKGYLSLPVRITD